MLEVAGRARCQHAGRAARRRAVGLVILLALFFLVVPGFSNLGGGGTATPSGSPLSSSQAGPSASLEPTEPPAPTPTLYTIKHNDTLSKIAKAYGITLEELMRANPTIKNPNKISEGQQITIPVPESSAPDTIGGSTTP